ncbi:hypothetical protein EDD21DRAFT_368698 [Dissophora ornata]|nr:hypothetical protein EDD21DRAFT_368698 [Dissophora ornata]
MQSGVLYCVLIPVVPGCVSQFPGGREFDAFSSCTRELCFRSFWALEIRKQQTPISCVCMYVCCTANSPCAQGR